MRLKIIIPASAIIIYLSLVAITWQPRHEIVQKWTIAIDTPNGVVLGSSNLKLVTVEYKGLISQKFVSGSTGLYGEAPYVKLGDNYLFVLALYEPYKLSLIHI